MSQKSTPGHFPPENFSPWCIKKHGCAHFHDGRLIGNPIAPLVKMSIMILQVYSMNCSVGIKSATQQPRYILNM